MTAIDGRRPAVFFLPYQEQSFKRQREDNQGSDVNVAQSKRCLLSRRTLASGTGPRSGDGVVAGDDADALQEVARNILACAAAGERDPMVANDPKRLRSSDARFFRRRRPYPLAVVASTAWIIDVMRPKRDLLDINTIKGNAS